MATASSRTDQIAGRLLTYLGGQISGSALEYASPLTQLQGGFDTSIYSFQLAGAPQDLRHRLVLRLFPRRYGPESALYEGSVQNALADEGFPAARVHFVCTNEVILGGAFMVMNFLAGESMMSSPLDTIPELLGQTHAALHEIESGGPVERLAGLGIDNSIFGFAGRLESLEDAARELPWMRESVDWLVENQPPEPDRLAICHGDFHPLNLLVQYRRVSGVLDWGGMLVADPALDVANTTILLTVPPRHLASSMGRPGLAAVDWDGFTQQYLAAYRAQRPLETTHVDYYRAARCIRALTEGARGHQVWRHPGVRADLVECVHRATGIDVAAPD